MKMLKTVGAGLVAASTWLMTNAALAWAPVVSEPSSPSAVPELDPSMAASALALLTAAALVVYGARKRG